MCKTIRSALAFPLILILFAACSDASFHQDTPRDKQNAVAEQDVQQAPSLGKKSRHPGFVPADEEPNETEPAYIPQQVSGSWLACVPVTASTYSNEELIGCAIVRDGKKQPLYNGTMSWQVTGADGNPRTVRVAQAHKATPFHVTIASDEDVSDAVVRVTLKFNGREPQIYETKVAGSAASVTATEENQTFHIGDGSYADSSCAKDLASVPTSGSAFEAQVRSDVDGPWLVTVSGLCGIDGPGMATLRIETDLGVTEVTNAGRETSLSLWIAAPAGSWSVKVIAGSRRGDIEDFLFSKLTIRGAQEALLDIH